jgi:polyphosphate kinase 2 (PPK2 family)
MLVSEGTILVKFFIHLSSKEQLKRFKARESDPLKSWKLTDEDWRNREKRKQYKAAIEDMLEFTDQPGAPWYLVEGDSKKWARVKIIETTIDVIEAGIRARGIDPPQTRYAI